MHKTSVAIAILLPASGTSQAQCPGPPSEATSGASSDYTHWVRRGNSLLIPVSPHSCSTTGVKLVVNNAVSGVSDDRVKLIIKNIFDKSLRQVVNGDG